MANYRRENYHVWTWGIAALIALALLWLWITGRGPSANCCSMPVAAVAASAPAIAPSPSPSPSQAPAPAAPVLATATPAAVASAPAAASPAAKPMATLYFDAGKTTPPADTDKLIADVLAYLKQNTAAKAVISGYNDPRGDAAMNAELSKNRAKAVREALKAAGVEETRIEMRKPADTNLQGDPKQARRVEITLEP